MKLRTWRLLIIVGLLMLAGIKIGQTWPELGQRIRHAYTPPAPDARRCPPEHCVIIRMRDGTTCRVYAAPYGSARPERWTCP